MRKLTRAQYKKVDKWLHEHRNIDRCIAMRKLELQEKHIKDLNSNIKKKNNVHRTTEAIVIKWETDEKIQKFERLKTAITATIETLDDELKSIFMLRWGNDVCNKWDYIAETKNIYNSYVYRKRNTILSIFADVICIFYGDDFLNVS